MNASHFESLAGLLSPKPEEPSLKDSLKRDAKVTKNQKNKNDIWDEEDAEEQVDLEDSRPAPEYVMGATLTFQSILTHCQPIQI